MFKCPNNYRLKYSLSPLFKSHCFRGRAVFDIQLDPNCPNNYRLEYTLSPSLFYLKLFLGFSMNTFGCVGSTERRQNDFLLVNKIVYIIERRCYKIRNGSILKDRVVHDLIETNNNLFIIKAKKRERFRRKSKGVKPASRLWSCNCFQNPSFSFTELLSDCSPLLFQLHRQAEFHFSGYFSDLHLDGLIGISSEFYQGRNRSQTPRKGDIALYITLQKARNLSSKPGDDRLANGRRRIKKLRNTYRLEGEECPMQANVAITMMGSNRYASWTHHLLGSWGRSFISFTFLCSKLSRSLFSPSSSSPVCISGPGVTFLGATTAARRLFWTIWHNGVGEMVICKKIYFRGTK